MRLTTRRDALLETLGKVKAAVLAKSTLPVCASVLIKAGKGMVELTANPLDFTLAGNCKASISTNGAVCVMPKPLETFLKAVGAEKVTLTGKGKILKVEAGNATTTLEGFEAKDFPLFPKVKGKVINLNGLAKALKEVSYARARDDVRPVLDGICFSPKEGGVEMAATDGFRLASTTVKGKGILPKQVIIPGKVIALIERLMQGKVSVQCSIGKEWKDTFVSFSGNGLTLLARPIQGSYPNYHQIIPKNGSRLTFDPKEMRDALKVVTATKPTNDCVRFQTKGKSLILSTRDDDGGQTEVKIPAKGKTQIAFNATYLKDLLSKLEGKIALRITDAQSPGVVRQNGTIHVLMPMNVQ